MKSIKSSIFSVLAGLLAMPSLAQSFEANPVLADASPATQQHIPSVVYKSVATENQLAGTISVDTIPGFGEGANMSSKARIFRADRLSVMNSRSNILSNNDQVSFTVNAPMPEVNGALSFVGTVSQTPLDDTLTKLIQVMTLLATRKINAEVAYSYSVKVNKYSSFNSVVSCKLDTAADSGKSSDVVARFQYSVKF